MRGRQVVIVQAATLVPGDIVRIKARRFIVPADLRLVSGTTPSTIRPL